MKKTVLFLAVCSVASASYAQTAAQIRSLLRNKWQPQTAAILNGQLQTAGKTTQTKQRVVAQAIYNTNNAQTALERTDSSRYKYSGIRGSKFGFSYMQFDDYMNSADVLFDSLTRWDNSNGTTLTYVDRSISKFNAAGKRDTLLQQTAGSTPNTLVNDTRYRYTYNSLGNVTIQYEDSWSGSAWTASTKTIYVYNSGNKLLADTTYNVNGTVLTPSERDFNTFDGSGNLSVNTHQFYSGGAWLNASRTTNSYYTTNLLKVSIVESANAAHVLKNSGKDSFGYTTNISFHTYDKSDLWDTTTNSWVNYIIEKKHLNATNLPDSMNSVIQFFGVAITDKLVFSYNSYGNPTLVTDYDDLFGIPGSGISGKSFYYYETYDDPTGVKEVPYRQSIVLFPNPATNDLNIKRETFTAKDIATIWNTAGQKLIQQTIGNSNTATISISSLAPGMYWLSVENEQGIVARQSFIKQ